MNTQDTTGLPEINKENWMHNKWRPAMGWMYMAVCITDFILYPVLWAVFQSYNKIQVQPWEPLTLQGAGLFHIAMGAVLGVTAWSRGQEKMAGVNNNGMQQSQVTSASNQTPQVTTGFGGRPAPIPEQQPIR